uniref:Uncharacterized protein n=1 Tax=Rhizophora mucronata TaxID=61149 RepID=A0A2P2QG51_RHIMU
MNFNTFSVNSFSSKSEKEHRKTENC